MKLRIISVLLSVLLTSWCHRASAQFTITAPPSLLSGEQQNGVSYRTTIGLFNSGRSYGMWEIANEGQVRDLAWGFGYLIPYAYRIELVNESTGKQDAAYFAIPESAGSIPRNEASLIPNNATVFFSLQMAGRSQMFGCRSGSPQLCTGFPGSEHRYRLVFEIYDTNCAFYNFGMLDVIHPSCRVVHVSTPATTVSWTEHEPAVEMATVPVNNSGVWWLSLYRSPLPAGAPAPFVGSNCRDGRSATRIRDLVYTITRVPVPDGPHCTQ
jgi:hypothetical protein